MDSSKSLDELAEVTGGHVVGVSETRVSDVTHDSRQVGPGALFAAIPGASFDGHDFVDQAVERGATAICVEHRLLSGAGSSVAQLVVDDTRAILGKLAAEIHGRPSESVDVIGVTGTNGKTTVTHFVHSLLTSLGIPTGLIGTLGSRIGSEPIESLHTTPEATDFQRLLALMRDKGAATVAVEVSSHALELRRVDGTKFSVAAFTNLSQDHLDFHGSMAEYQRAKERLFEDFAVGLAVVNVDDPVGSDIAAKYTGDLLRVGSSGDFGFSDVKPESSGTSFTVHSPQGHMSVIAPVFGSFNVANFVLSIACAYALGVDLDRIWPHVSSVPVVPGRFEIVNAGFEPGVTPRVIVDYAHTPAGIEKAVETGRQMTSGRLIVVFGAGGDRDAAKRPLMGRASGGADVVIVTSDNPRSEDPDSVIRDVVAGAPPDARRVSDRREAIATAISIAGVDDLVMVLGKGHETGQEIGGTVFPFDDRIVVREELIRRRKSANLGNDSGSMVP